MDHSNSTSGATANQSMGLSLNDSSDSKSSRKRTKTGCLTCRQRRIKCGEERPKCQNCAKSKRDCQGYNQRVIFKEPLNAFRPPASVSRLVTPVPQQLQHAQFRQFERPSQPVPFQQYEQVSQKAAPTIPTPNFSSVQIPTSLAKPSVPMQIQNQQQLFHSYQPESGSSTSESSPEATAPLTPSSQAQEDFEYHSDHFENSQNLDPSQRRAPQEAGLQYNYDAFAQPPKNEPRQQKQPFKGENVSPSFGWHSDPNSTFQSTPYERITPSDIRTQQNNPNYAYGPLSPSQRLHEGQNHAPYHQEQSFVASPNQQSPFSPHFPNQNQFPSQFHESNWHATLPFTTASGRVVENDNDDPYGDESVNRVALYGLDTEVEIQDRQLKRNDLGNVMALQAIQDNQNSSLRSFSTFLDEPNILAAYEPLSSPTSLQDPMTARIFLHFINVTGQSISMYERHPADPSLMFSGRPVPHGNQHLWSYTMPTLALLNPGLLHAMLAIASLHMANLQDTSTIPSLKHYHIALRKVAKGLNSTRRGHPAILAATMLLGFYEVMSADHQKWTSHLLGAKHLIKEINFGEKTKEVNAIKKKRRACYSQRRLAHYDDEIDEDFIAILTGEKLDEDRRGGIIDEQQATKNYIHTDRDIEIYENQRDLFWWFCKQDVYQSILSGNELFFEYENWRDCPPRAPMGRWEASYGTFDHVILLLGRAAAFASKDLARKKKVLQLNGGVWCPAPGMQIPSPPPGKGPPRGPHGVPQMPPFAGMMPTGGPATLPMGFSPSSSSPKPVSDNASLEIQTARALQEWEEIRKAFNILASRFGADFRPIDTALAGNPIETPFGPAYQFKSYAMAGIWMNYYMGLIVHARSHPYMPPSAQMAAGIAAGQTKTWAQELGRVCGGLITPSSEKDLSTLHGSGMIECSVPIFTAAVQYQTPPERAWTIKKLHDISRLTGWKTAAVIAGGCEGAWMKLAENGRGAPYTRYSGDGTEISVSGGSDKGGVYWGFDGGRIGSEEVGYEDGRGERRAVLYKNRDKDYVVGDTYI